MKLTKVLKSYDDFAAFKKAIDYMEGGDRIKIYTHLGTPDRYPCLAMAGTNPNETPPTYRYSFIYPEEAKDYREYKDIVDEGDLDDLLKASLEMKIKGFAEKRDMTTEFTPICAIQTCTRKATHKCDRDTAYYCDYDRHYLSCCANLKRCTDPTRCSYGCELIHGYYKCSKHKMALCSVHRHSEACCEWVSLYKAPTIEVKDETPKTLLCTPCGSALTYGYYACTKRPNQIICGRCAHLRSDCCQWVSTRKEELPARRTQTKRRCDKGCEIRFGGYYCSTDEVYYCGSHYHLQGNCCRWKYVEEIEREAERLKIEGVQCQEGCKNDVDHFCSKLLEYRCSIHCHADKCCMYIFGTRAAGPVKVVDRRDGEPEPAPEPKVEVEDPREVKFVEDPDDKKA